MTGLVDRVKGWITTSGGVVGDVDVWGRRRLAYAIKRQTEGQYVFVPAQIPAEAARELERNLRLTEQVMRFMITSVE
jgi:small subunit ribosomal protein S6